MKRIGVILPSVLALAACGGDPGPSADGGSASGEVLEGSISDAMLPLDTLQSQSPPLGKPPSDAASSETPAADEPAEAADELEPAPEAEVPAPEEE